MGSLGKAIGGAFRGAKRAKEVPQKVAKIEWHPQPGPGAADGPVLGSQKAWRKHVAEGKYAVYDLPDKLENVVSIPGYIVAKKGGKQYLVRKNFAKDFAKQEGIALRKET